MSKNNPWLPLLTPHQLVEISSAFKRFDRDGDGHIEPHELRTVMNNLGVPQSEEAVKKLIASVDVDGNGMIEFDEFIGVMAQRMLKTDTDGELDLAFSTFDPEGTGKVHVDDISRSFTQMGSYRLGADDMTEMLKLLKPDADGFISIEDFKAMECWHVPMPEIRPAGRKKSPRPASSTGEGEAAS